LIYIGQPSHTFGRGIPGVGVSALAWPLSFGLGEVPKGTDSKAGGSSQYPRVAGRTQFAQQYGRLPVPPRPLVPIQGKGEVCIGTKIPAILTYLKRPEGLGSDPETFTLRVTTIFRREQGEWRVVHRHGDPFDAATREVLSRRRVQGAM
jgi:hypothetical protein